MKLTAKYMEKVLAHIYDSEKIDASKGVKTMAPLLIEKLKADKAALIEVLNPLPDYTLCVKNATQYKTNSEPNILVIIRLVNRIKKNKLNN